MEYTFQNSLKEKATTLKLEGKSMEMIRDKMSRIISYEEIIEVRLSHRRNYYQMSVTLLDESTIEITNYAYRAGGQRVDQSRIYMTFVRVFHVHLYGKSKASFQTGCDVNTLLLRGAGIVAGAVLIFFAAHYLQWLPSDPGFILAFFIVSLLILLYRLRISQWPKSYNPAHVPVHLLPPAA